MHGMRITITLSFAIFLLASAAFGQNEEANTNLSDAPFFDAEPSIAVSPIDQNRLVAAWMGTTGIKVTIHTRTSTDGGVTWTATTAMPHLAASYESADVSVAFNSKGEAFLCYVDYKASTIDSADVVVARSSDGGLTWLQPTIVRTATETNDVAVDRPWLAIDNSGGPKDGTLYVSSKPYMTNTNPNHTHLKHSTDDGVTWSADVRIDDSTFAPSNQSSMAVMSVGPNSTLYLLYFSFNLAHGVQARLIACTSTDGGETFTKHQSGDMVTTSIDSNWQYGYAITANPTKAGNAVVSWIDSRQGDPDVYSAYTTDAGSTWSTPIRVNDDPPNNGAGQDMVWCGFSPSGTLAMTWRDRRGLGTGAETEYNVYGAISSDGGATFSPNKQLSATSSSFKSLTRGNDFLGVTIDSSYAHTVWGNFTTQWEVYYDRHPLTDLAVSEHTSKLASGLSITSLFPNPASGSASLNLTLTHRSDIQIRLVNENGSISRELPDSHFESGSHTVQVNLSGLTEGAYCCEVFDGVETVRSKIIVGK
jgi:hypothetical protein